MVDVTLGVETRNLVAGAALADNATKATALIAVLRKQGVATRDIQTSQLTISPQYGQDGRRITGYTVTNVVTARLRKVDSAGRVIDAAVAAAGDALRVQGTHFSIIDPDPLMAKARALAVKDARRQATELADAAGVHLGALRSIRGSAASANPPPMVFATPTQVAAASPVLAGSQEVTAEVDLVYDIG